MRKLLSLLLVVMVMASALVVASAEGTTSLPPMNTTDPITLTIVDEQPARCEYYKLLAEKFTEKYPNITIEVVQIIISESYDAGLNNMLASGQQVDMGCAYYYTGGNAYNRICYDLTEFVENDPDYQAIYKGLQNFGYYDGERCFTIPGSIRPYMAFFDMTAFNKANIEVPTNAEMTAEKLMGLLDSLTDPSAGMFTLSGSNWLPDVLTASLTENAKGNYGWNGETLDFTVYSELLDYSHELISDGHYTWNGEENYLAVQPDDTWIGLSTRVGIYLHDYTNWPTMLDPAWKDAYGVNYVPYFMPLSEEVENSGQQTWVAQYFISADCEYPREAYEALKYLVWGEEGWLERLEMIPRLCMDENGGYFLTEETYQEAEARCKETGETMPKYYQTWTRGTPWELPAIRTEAVMDKIVSLMPDLGYWNDWEGLFDSLTNAVPSAHQFLLGWDEFNTDVYTATSYNGWNDYMWAAFRGIVTAADYTELLNNGFPPSREKAIEKLYSVYGTPGE